MRRLVFCLALLLAHLLGWVGGLAQADLVVVVNARSGMAVMTRNEVVNLFFGRSRQFFNGLEALPVDFTDGHPQRARFYQELVGRDIAQVDAYWSRQVFSGRMQPLPRVTSAEEVLRWVVSHPGGIGYLDSSMVDARVRVVHELSHERH